MRIDRVETFLIYGMRNRKALGTNPWNKRTHCQGLGLFHCRGRGLFTAFHCRGGVSFTATAVRSLVRENDLLREENVQLLCEKESIIPLLKKHRHDVQKVKNYLLARLHRAWCSVPNGLFYIQKSATINECG